MITDFAFRILTTPDGQLRKSSEADHMWARVTCGLLVVFCGRSVHLVSCKSVYSISQPAQPLFWT